MQGHRPDQLVADEEAGVLVIDQQVGQFQVSMHDPAIVQKRTRLQQLADKCLGV